MNDLIKKDDVVKAIRSFAKAIRSFAKEKIDEGKHTIDTVDTAVKLILKIEKMKEGRKNDKG